MEMIECTRVVQREPELESIIIDEPFTTVPAAPSTLERSSTGYFAHILVKNGSKPLPTRCPLTCQPDYG